MNPIKIHCKACDGSGKATLPKHLAELLSLFKGRTKLTANQVNVHLKLDTANAVNMRLERLRSLGLLTRDASARPYQYMKANPDEAKKVAKAAAAPKPTKTPRKYRDKTL